MHFMYVLLINIQYLRDSNQSCLSNMLYNISVNTNKQYTHIIVFEWSILLLSDISKSKWGIIEWLTPIVRFIEPIGKKIEPQIFTRL